MEYIDVLTPQGEPTGQSLSRDVIHTEGHWHRTVHIWVINSKRELLLQLRAPGVAANPGKWDISAAGHIPAGESSRDAAVRECEEELGLPVTADELNYVFSVTNETESDGHIDRSYNDIYILQRDVAVADLRLQVEEVSDVRWASAEQLLAWIGDNDFVAHDEEYQKLAAYFEVGA